MQRKLCPARALAGYAGRNLATVASKRWTRWAAARGCYRPGYHCPRHTDVLLGRRSTPDAGRAPRRRGPGLRQTVRMRSNRRGTGGLRSVLVRSLVAIVALGTVWACDQGPQGPGLPGASRPASPSATPTGTGTPTPPAATPTATSTATATPTPGTPSAADCARDTARDMDDAHLAGQLILMGIPSTNLPGSARTVLADDHVGGVFMIGNSYEGVAHTREVTNAARSADRNAHLMVTADQEGGQIQRLRGSGFDRMPTAVDQAGLPDRTLMQRAEVWGRQLADAGVDTNLAPVADVVPADIGPANKPIYALQRGYGSTPAAVAPKVVAYLEGMHAAGRGTALKHFPGLGQVKGNTDFVRDVTDTRTRRDDALLATFRKGIEAHTDMVMIALATYSRIDARQPAAFSATIITGMLRVDLGFHGVVVSDDMNALQVRNLSASARAWRFLQAGGDLITIGDPAVAGDMAHDIRERMRGSDQARQQVRDSAVRVLTMKARLGLLRCG